MGIQIKYAVFGPQVMAQCTPLGTKSKMALPQKELLRIKEAIFELYPQYWLEPERFDAVWKRCYSKSFVSNICIRTCTSIILMRRLVTKTIKYMYATIFMNMYVQS